VWQIDRRSEGDVLIPPPPSRGVPRCGLEPIRAKLPEFLHGRVHSIATFDQPKSSAMRVLLIPLGLFVYVATDITVNNGASVRGWLAMIGAMAHSIPHL
jgi:hypothetical protein